MRHKPQQKRLTPFERETERRRREMLGYIAGFRGRISGKRLRFAYTPHQRRFLMAKGAPKAVQA